jgi:exonuclease III
MHFLMNKKEGIIFLQETHSVPSDVKVWESEWKGQIFMAHGTTHARGVAILIPKSYKTDLIRTVIDENGRYIFLEGKFNGQELGLINYYGPTTDKQSEQIDYFHKLLPYINEISHKLIMGGDFNTCLAPEFDRYKSKDDNPTKFANFLQNTMDENSLVDIWRIKNPETRRYTWRKVVHKGIQQSRLDMWLIANSFIYKTNDTTIDTSILSDHNLITLELETLGSLKNRGRGSWKLNTSFLKEKEYVNMINTLIEEWKDKYRNVSDKRLKWDVIKMEIRSCTISYAVFRAKEKKSS